MRVPLNVFYSYSHKDEGLRREIEKHLSPLRREGLVADWHDRVIRTGEDWRGEIDGQVNSADIILLLVSSDFLSSDYCYEEEVRCAIERHDRKEAWAVPVILRPCDWSGCPFAKLQVLPKDGKPVTKWKNRDDAYTEIVEGLRVIASEVSIHGTRKKARGFNASETTDAVGRSFGLAVGTGVSTNRTVEITIDRDFDSYTKEEEAKFVEALKNLLDITDVRIRKRRGSVKLLVDGLPPEKVEQLISAVDRGDLDEFNVCGARVLSRAPTPDDGSELERPGGDSRPEFRTSGMRTDSARDLLKHGVHLSLLARLHFDDRLRPKYCPDDVVRETLTSACRDWATYRGATAYQQLHWLLTILANRIAHFQRRLPKQSGDLPQERSLEKALNESAVRIGSLASTDAAAERVVVRKEMSIRVAQALSELPVLQYECIVRHYLEGEPVSRVARDLELSIPAVARHLQRGMSRLRKQIDTSGNQTA